MPGTFNYYAVSADGRHYLPIGDQLVLASRLQIGNIRPGRQRPDERAVLEEIISSAARPASAAGAATKSARSARRAADRRRQHAGVQRGAARARCAAILGGVLFLDAGNVWADSWGFKLGDLRYAVGPGLRYQTPIGPIRFDVGYQLNPIPGSARERQPADALGALLHFQHRTGVLAMRIVKRLTHVLVIVLTLVVGAAAAAVIVSQTAWFKNWLRGYIVREANQYLNGTLSIERLGGNLFFGVEMENVGVSMDGSQVVAVKDLGLDYNVFQLLTKGLSVDSIRLDKPVIYLRREGDTWSLSRLVKKQETEADRSGPAKPIAIDAIGITDGSVVVDSPVGTSGRRGAEALRSSRREAVVQVRAGALLDRDHARVVPRIRAGDRAQRAVGRRRGEGRHGVRREAGAADGGDVAVGGRRRAALPVEADLQPADQLGQAVAARRSRGSCRRSPASGCSRRST